MEHYLKVQAESPRPAVAGTPHAKPTDHRRIKKKKMLFNGG